MILRRSVFNVLFGLVVSFGSAGCMATPNEGDVIAPGSNVVFSGYYPAPSVTVHIKAYRPATGTFEPFAQATSATSGFTTADGTSYPWSIEAAIPLDAWEQGRTGVRATLRAATDDDHSLLATDSEWLTCFTDNGSSMEAFAENCSLADPDSTHVYSADYTPFPLRGDEGCAYGTFGCNPCVTDVPSAFARASGSKHLRSRFHFAPVPISLNGLEPDSFARICSDRCTSCSCDHIQSAARIPGLAFENVLALSRNARDLGDGAIFLAMFDGIESHGDAWEWAYSRTSDTAVMYYYYRIPGTNHTGGMQALGPMLFAANDCDQGLSCSAFVEVFDVRDPRNMQLLSELVLDGSEGELSYEGSEGAVSSRAAAVAAVRLSNGHHLIFIRGREADKSGWFFESDGPVEEGARFHLVDFWHEGDLASGTPWDAWENLNFISECDSGWIYMVAMGTHDNESFLYRLDETPTPGTPLRNMNFSYVDGRGLNTSGRSVSTAYGTGVHVTPSGNLVSYVTDKYPPILINEFRYHGDHLD